MSQSRIFIDSFEAGPLVTGKTTYAEFRTAVLKAGRFSAFEASVTRASAKMYDRLCRDPWIETDTSCGYPWTKVRKRSEPKPESVEVFECVGCKAESRIGGPYCDCGYRVMKFKRSEPIPPSEAEPVMRSKEAK